MIPRNNNRAFKEVMLILASAKFYENVCLFAILDFKHYIILNVEKLFTPCQQLCEELWFDNKKLLCFCKRVH